MALYEAWYRFTFRKLFEQIELIQNENNELSNQWNQILALSESQKISLPEANLKFREEERILASNDKESIRIVENNRRKREEWIAAALKKESDRSTEENFEDLFRNENRNKDDRNSNKKEVKTDFNSDSIEKQKKNYDKGKSSLDSEKISFVDKKNKQLFLNFQQNIKNKYAEIWECKVEDVNWQNIEESCNFLGMWYLRGVYFASWEKFDKGYLRAPIQIRKKFKKEFEQKENRNFDLSINTIKEESIALGKKLGWYFVENSQSGNAYKTNEVLSIHEQALAAAIKVKILFRKLVFKLHPDHIKIKLTKDKWEILWNEVQESHKNKNLKKLNEILLLVSFLEEPFFLAVSELDELEKYLKEEVEILKLSTSHLNQLPAWGFSQKKSFISLEKKAKKELMNQLNFCKALLEETKNRFSYLNFLTQDLIYKLHRTKNRGFRNKNRIRGRTLNSETRALKQTRGKRRNRVAHKRSDHYLNGEGDDSVGSPFNEL